MRLPLRHVLCATDLSTVGDGAAPIAYALAGPGATVHLLHVVEPVAAAHSLSLGPMAGVPTLQEDVEPRKRAARRHLEGLVPADAAARGVKTQIRVVHEIGTASAIEQEARRLKADLIVVGTRGRPALAKAVLGSVANAVLRHARVPVLLFHEPAFGESPAS